jgi:hypothetical protein
MKLHLIALLSLAALGAPACAEEYDDDDDSSPVARSDGGTSGSQVPRTTAPTTSTTSTTTPTTATTTPTTSSTTPTTSTSATTPGTRLTVQLLYENGVAVGAGGYLEYMRYRLYGDGTFESCAYQSAFRPGSQSNQPAERLRGSYEILGSTLKLRYPSGATESLSFAYSAAEREATIDGKHYEQEQWSAISITELCDFSG